MSSHWPRHTKGVKNGTSSSLAAARIKRVVLGSYYKKISVNLNSGRISGKWTLM